MSCLGQCWPSRHILPHHAADGCSRQVSSTNSVIITKFTINKKMIKNDVKVCCWWRFSSSSTTGMSAPTLCAAGFAGQTTEQVFYRKIQRKVLFTQYILKTTFKVFFSRRARREGFCGRSGRKASAAQPTFTELTGSEALDKPLQDMISYVIRSAKIISYVIRSAKMVAVMEVVRLYFP